MSDYLLELRNLSKHYTVRQGLFTKSTVQALDRVSLTLQAGQTLGIVGESGCGKTTLARCILRIIEPTAGTILFQGHDLVPLSAAQLKVHRREIAIVYQNPFLSLNPGLHVQDIIAEPIRAHQSLRGSKLAARVEELLEAVGLDKRFMQRRAHEMSGGQAQRVAIARALALHPRLVILDEPSSALDVSVQAQVLNLLTELQQNYGMAYMLISHNLDVIQHMANHVAVMYLGQIVEYGPVEQFFARPNHPYTHALLAATPRLDGDSTRKAMILEGQVPNAARPPSGCRFHPRCPFAQDICRQVEPELRTLGPEYRIACHFAPND